MKTVKLIFNGIGKYLLALILLIAMEFIYTKFFNGEFFIQQFMGLKNIILGLVIVLGLPFIAVFIKPLRKGILTFIILVIAFWFILPGTVFEFSDSYNRNKEFKRNTAILHGETPPESKSEDTRVNGIYELKDGLITHKYTIAGDKWWSETFDGNGDLYSIESGIMKGNEMWGEHGIVKYARVKNGEIRFVNGIVVERK